MVLTGAQLSDEVSLSELVAHIAEIGYPQRRNAKPRFT
jgi:hypothetical protein